MKRLLKKFWKRRKLRIFTIGLVLMLTLTVVGVEVSSQSWFCNSCHIMNSYYASWETSAHSDVDCVACHIEPGLENFVAAKLNGAGQVVDDLLHRTSTKPSASVSDFSCTRAGCHAMADVLATNRREPPFFFEHAKHLNLKDHNGIAVHCTTCHSHVKGREHFEVNTNVCITCHLAPGSSDQPAVAAAVADGNAAGPKIAPRDCRFCHDAPTETIEYQGLTINHAEYLQYNADCRSCHRNVTEQPARIDDDKCVSCHDFGRERMTDVAQLHRVHTEGAHKVECFSCHGLTRHGPTAQAMQLEQLDCRACHAGQHQLQQAAYKARPESHTQPAGASAVTPMFMAHVDCTGCHVQPREISDKPHSGATVAAATAESCDTCHQKGLGDQMIPLWQKNTRTLYEKAMTMLPADEAGLDPAAAKRVAEARHLLEMVKLDGSWGVHNPQYTQGLIQRAMELLRGPTTTAGEEVQP